MTQSRCWECNNMFPGFGYQTLCSACYQTRKVLSSLENQPRVVQSTTPTPAPPPQPLFIYRPDPNEPWPEYVPPTAEESQKKKKIKRLDRLFSLLVDSSILAIWGLLWIITSGWVTLVGFIAAIYIPFYLNEKHQHWRIENAKYLYQI